MPTEYFNGYAFVQTGSVETVDQTLLVFFRVVDQVIYLKLVSSDVYHRIVLGVDLPIAVIVVHVQQTNRGVGQTFPSLESDEQTFDPRVVASVVENGHQIFVVELAADNFAHLLLVPLFVVQRTVLLALFDDLFENC